jgi:hypothetical protein
MEITSLFSRSRVLSAERALLGGIFILLRQDILLESPIF